MYVDEDKEVIETIELDDTHKVATGVYEYYYVIPSGKSPLVFLIEGYVNSKKQNGELRVQRFSRIL